MPRQICGAADKIERSVVRISEVAQGIEKHRLVADYAQRHVYSAHSHVVYFALPALPVPPAGGIRKRAVVHVGAFVLLDNADCLARGQGSFGYIAYPVVAAVGEIDPAAVLQVSVICHCKAYLAVAAQNYFVAARLDFIEALALAPVLDFECEPVGNLRRISFNQLLHQSVLQL